MICCHVLLVGLLSMISLVRSFQIRHYYLNRKTVGSLRTVELRSMSKSKKGGGAAVKGNSHGVVAAIYDAQNSWYSRNRDSHYVLHVKVQPNARESEICGLLADDVVGGIDNRERLKVKLAAPPVDGKANKEIVAYLAKEMHVAKSNLCLIRGEKDTHKDILCQGVTEEQIRSLLSQLST